MMTVPPRDAKVATPTPIRRVVVLIRVDEDERSNGPCVDLRHPERVEAADDHVHPVGQTRVGDVGFGDPGVPGLNFDGWSADHPDAAPRQADRAVPAECSNSRTRA